MLPVPLAAQLMVSMRNSSVIELEAYDQTRAEVHVAANHASGPSEPAGAVHPDGSASASARAVEGYNLKDEGLDAEDSELLAEITHCFALAEETLSFEKIYARDVVRRMEHASEAERRSVLYELVSRDHASDADS
jgi:hypothetical protein